MGPSCSRRSFFVPPVFDAHSEPVAGRFAIVVSRYNENITGKLLDGATKTLSEAGIAERDVDVAWVPGAWEIPLVAQHFAAARTYAAVICLGAVIRGETTHDQHINQQVAGSLAKISLEFNVPVAFGLLTCKTLEQAIQRSGGNVGNKGVECAKAAMELSSLMNSLSK